MYKSNFVNIKSINVRDVLRKVLKEIIYVNFRENKPLINIFLRMIVISDSRDILYKLIRIFYLFTYLN
jgi:hypothetical protein